MKAETLALLIWLTGLVAVALLLLPVVFYLFTGWIIRRDKLLSYLGPEALKVYYSQFPYSTSEEHDLTKRFKKQFNYLYGRRHFVLPLLLFGSLCSLGIAMMVRSIQAHFGLTTATHAVPPTALFALAGGFIWVLGDELASVARRDVGPKDIHGWSFRLFLSVPFGLAVSHLATPEIGYPIAFFMGTFPTQTLFVIGRRLATSKLGLGDDGGDSTPELCSLQSVSRGNAEAFQDQGITTIAALAWADPVDLTIRTNFDFNFVLDCMSQALLWVYFEGKTRSLFPYSLRGSQEVLALMTAFDSHFLQTLNTSDGAFPQSEVKTMFTEAAAKLGMSLESFVTTLRQVALDPYTQFIAKVWK